MLGGSELLKNQEDLIQEIVNTGLDIPDELSSLVEELKESDDC